MTCARGRQPEQLCCVLRMLHICIVALYTTSQYPACCSQDCSESFHHKGKMMSGVQGEGTQAGRGGGQPEEQQQEAQGC